ncbi:NUDIX domain-containing protein [Streptomyces yatensis]|uniref:Nudix hydrolase domain-containing protein n=1 Tax=Streptomyces yatensis TaxID=155177 RepID=A0ABN2IQF5_9ACTN|nr:NUDIX domain-containing protein [Streptomyces yatensis]
MLPGATSKWPGGNADAGEDPLETARREAVEETGPVNATGAAIMGTYSCWSTASKLIGRNGPYAVRKSVSAPPMWSGAFSVGM